MDDTAVEQNLGSIGYVLENFECFFKFIVVVST